MVRISSVYDCEHRQERGLSVNMLTIDVCKSNANARERSDIGHCLNKYLG